MSGTSHSTKSKSKQQNPLEYLPQMSNVVSHFPSWASLPPVLSESKLSNFMKNLNHKTQNHSNNWLRNCPSQLDNWYESFAVNNTWKLNSCISERLLTNVFHLSLSVDCERLEAEEKEGEGQPHAPRPPPAMSASACHQNIIRHFWHYSEFLKPN